MRQHVLSALAALLLATRGATHASDVPPGSPALVPTQALQRIEVRFHLVTDLTVATQGVEMTHWLTPEMIAKTVMPEVNRIWSAARIEWTLSGVSPATTRSENRTDTIACLLTAGRDSEGHGDPQRIRKLQSVLNLEQEDARAVNVYVVPYLGRTLQGNASPRQKRVILGQWTDKPSRGKRPPERCLLVENGEFRQGSLSRTVAHELGHILGLSHPPRSARPLHRLMGGSDPGIDLTDEEKATARKTAALLFSKSKQR
jgi:hypothetical protein